MSDHPLHEDEGSPEDDDPEGAYTRYYLIMFITVVVICIATLTIAIMEVGL